MVGGLDGEAELSGELLDWDWRWWWWWWESGGGWSGAGKGLDWVGLGLYGLLAGGFRG